MLHRQKMLIAKHQDSNLFNNIKRREKICAMEFRLLVCRQYQLLPLSSRERERKKASSTIWSLISSLANISQFWKRRLLFPSETQHQKQTNKKPPPQNPSTFSLSYPGIEFCIGVAGREENLHSMQYLNNMLCCFCFCLRSVDVGKSTTHCSAVAALSKN